MQNMNYRNISQYILEALEDSPVVLLNGARQTGKSTLAKWLVANGHPARYLTFDDAGVLSAARSDPQGFLSGLEGAVVLDEIQRVPELFLAIKLEVDQTPQPGRFLLTGSANVLLLPRLSESLAGRMEIFTLWPFSQGEIEGHRETFIDQVFGDTLPAPTVKLDPDAHRGLPDRVLKGGYPKVLKRRTGRRRSAWFGSYITTVLQRDVRDLAQIEGLTDMPRLLSLLAARATSMVNFSEFSRSLGMPQTTLKRYMSLLRMTFLVQMLPAWSANLGKRVIKSPKLVLGDTGLMAHLTGIDHARLARDPSLMGALLENFVIMELRKQLTWSHTRAGMFHFRARTGEEVDIVLEDAAGRVVGIEVKSRAAAREKDFAGLKMMAEALGDRFIRGVVLYNGAETIPFGARLHAIPISALWSSREGGSKGNV